MWVQTIIYVILKGQNGGLILDENHSFSNIMEPHLYTAMSMSFHLPICVI